VFFETVYDTKEEEGIKEFNVWDLFVALLSCQLGRKVNSLWQICGGLASVF